MAQAVTAVQRKQIQSAMGELPRDIDFTTTNHSAYISALNVYRRLVADSEHDQMIISALQSISTPLISQFNSPKVLSAVVRGLSQQDSLRGWVAAVLDMISNGCTVEQKTINRLIETLQLARRYGAMKSEARVQALSLAEKTKAVSIDFTAAIDEQLDLQDSGHCWSQLFEQWNLKANHAKHIVKVYADQYRDIVDNPEDYRNVSVERKRSYRNLVDSLNNIISGKTISAARAAEIITKSKAPAKTLTVSRRGKKSDPFKLFTYKPVDTDLNIESISPAKIVGREVAFLYNSKYKVLTMLVAEKGQTLDIRRSTIINVCEKSSKAKRAGRAAKNLKVLAEAPRSQAIAFFNKIDSEEISASGRSSEHTLLVRSFK